MCTRWIFALQKVKWFLHKIYRRAYLTPRARADAAEVVQVPRHCHVSLVICQTEDRPPQADFFFLKIISFSSRSFVHVTPEWLHPWRLATPFLGPDFKAKQRCALWMAQGQGGWKPRAKKEKSWLRSGRKSTFLVLFFGEEIEKGASPRDGVPAWGRGGWVEKWCSPCPTVKHSTESTTEVLEPLKNILLFIYYFYRALPTFSWPFQVENNNIYIIL